MPKPTLLTIDASEKDNLLAKTKEELALMVKEVDSQMATLSTSRRHLMLLINFKAAFEAEPVVQPAVIGE